MSAMQGDPATLERLASAGIESAADVLEAAECVRDLPERANHVLSIDDATWFVKHEKRRRRRGDFPREAAGIERLQAAGVPVSPLAFLAHADDGSAVTGTPSLAPARPLDDLLREGAVSGPARRRLSVSLATAVARMHSASLHHKDLYLNHCFAEPVAGTVQLIDLERVGRHRRLLGRWVVKDLAALRHSVPEGTVPEREQLRFLLSYLRERGIPSHGVIRGLVRRVRAKARRIGRRAPRTPVGEIARPPTATE